MNACLVCGDEIAPRPTPGRPRLYCSGRCRTEAYRTRLALEAEPVPASSQLPPEAVLRAELLEVADVLIADAAAAPPEDRLVRAVIETRILATQYRRLEPELPSNLAWRAAEAGRRIDAVVEDLFEPEADRGEG